MAKSWEDFEKHVRTVASYIWEREAGPQRIGGVNIDCVLKLSEDRYVLIEITEERSLEKVRGDVVKLNTARASLFTNELAHAQCFCVVNADNITASMLDAGKELKIQVASANKFEKNFFDFDSYRTARERVQFGSAVDPITGEKDEKKYVPVTYLIENHEISVGGIADLLLKGKKVVMTGEYGSGKSRCIREVFLELAKKAAETGQYPIAIDLRDNWGLKRAPEILRRHFGDLGLEGMSSRILKSIKSSFFIFLLDGFDELGFQSWSDDTDKLRSMRMRSLDGVRDLVQKTGGGLLICGREHYFNSNDDMFQSLGLSKDATVGIQSKREFTEEELGEYMESNGSDYAVPTWIPKRPLICQTIVSLGEEDLDRMFGQEGDDVEFWETFVRLLCERDARISMSLDADTIFGVLVALARSTRIKPGNFGPITLGEIQHAFEAVVRELPNDQASVMLQRLPGLGRVKAESNDRQFIDIFILDGLRAVDVSEHVAKGAGDVDGIAWTNPLELLGQRVLSNRIRATGAQKLFLQIANRCASSRNRVLASDIVASLMRTKDGEYEFGGLAIDDGHFAEFDMTTSVPVNLRILNSYFGTLTLCSVVPKGTWLQACIADQIIGVTSAKGLPSWADVVGSRFQAAVNVATIRKLGLKPTQEVLVTVIRKTFFQKGSGRKEEALLRGLGKVAAPGTAKKILNLLLREGILESFRGDEGYVYSPKRSHADRMQKMIDQLSFSDDPIWKEVSSM